MKTRINIIKQGIKNIFFWIKTIWKDRDFDFYYFYEILKKKLEKQIKFLSKNDFNSYEINRMKLCIKLIDLINNDHYINELFDLIEYDLKYNKNDNFYKLTINTKAVEDYIKKNSLKAKKFLNEKNLDDLDDEYKEKIAILIATNKQNKANELLFKILSNHIYKWWI